MTNYWCFLERGANGSLVPVLVWTALGSGFWSFSDPNGDEQHWVRVHAPASHKEHNVTASFGVFLFVHLHFIFLEVLEAKQA